MHPPLAATYFRRSAYTGDLVEAHAFDDPHLALAEGGNADFRGEDNAIYNLLSAKNLSLNTRFQDANFSLPGPRHKLVHGRYFDCCIGPHSSLPRAPRTTSSSLYFCLAAQ